jgi:hypothetical protein
MSDDSIRCIEPLPEGPAAKTATTGPMAAGFADALNQNLAIGVRAAVADHLGRAPTRAEVIAGRRAAHRLAAVGLARVLYALTTMQVIATILCRQGRM